jgi:Xaa-Pro dipeptidase
MTLARITKLQHDMKAASLDAVIISNTKNFFYFTGHLPLLSLSPTRPWYLVVPAAGDPIACVPAIGLDDMRDESWIKTIQPWPSPNPDDEGRSCLIDVLSQLTKTHHRFGFEFGREMRITMPAADFDAIRNHFHTTHCVDVAELIWSLRLVKDENEIAAMRRAIAAAKAGFAEIGSQLKIGMTEQEAARTLIRLIMGAGADAVPYLACGSGPGGYPSLTRKASSRRLEAGDIIGFDVGATVDGYWCDFNRNYQIGPAHTESAACEQALQAAMTAAIPFCKAGTPVADLRRIMIDVTVSAGFTPSTAGRWGHGVGLDFTEPPSLTFQDDCVLRAGMVITLEPSLTLRPNGLFLVTEEMVCVSINGPELLTL